MIVKCFLPGKAGRAGSYDVVMFILREVYDCGEFFYREGREV